MIQQKLRREASTGRVSLMAQEEEKHLDSSCEDSLSVSSAARL
jgi:hypothetical protein